MITVQQFIKSCACRTAGECSCNAHAETNAWDALVDQFAAEMKRKFRRKLAEGRAGWDDPESRDGIRQAMVEHARRGLFQEIDVANLACMLWNGRQPTQETLPALDMSGQPMGDPHPADLTRNGQCPVCGCTLGYHRWNCSLNQV